MASYMYRGDAYGGSVFINSSGNGGNAAQLNPIRYKGYYYDAETGFYYLQSRYYDPSICRFINADIFCDTGTGTAFSTNMFAYCENDPVNYADPSGESYSPLKAQNYANNYWRNYNKGYNNYPNHDCTNFVSQCLHAGGLRMDDFWHSYKLKNGWDISRAWRSNHYLIPYLEITGHIKSCSKIIYKISEIKKGLEKMKGKDKRIEACSFIIIFFQGTRMAHSAINGYVASNYSDVDYYAHTADRFGYDCINTVKDYLRKNNQSNVIYSVVFYRIK